MGVKEERRKDVFQMKTECKVPVDKIYYREKKEEVIGHFFIFYNGTCPQ